MTELIKINDKEYLKEYNNINKDCFMEGYILPTLLEMIDVPPNIIKSDKKLKQSEEAEERMNNMSAQRVSDLYQIKFNGDLEKLSNELNEYYNKEVLDFILQFPQYQSILK